MFHLSEMPTEERAARLCEITAMGAPGIVDVRSADAYAAGHLRNASSFPFHELRLRTAELPPQTAEGVHIVAEPGPALAAALAFMRGDPPPDAAPQHKPSKGWLVLGVIEATDSLWDSARRLDLFETGNRSRRLWAPSLHLPHLVPMLEAEVAGSSAKCAAPANALLTVAAVAAAAVAMALAASGRPRSACSATIATAVAVGAHVARRKPTRTVLHAVDLGCGRGRDCIWLAQRGWSVVGVDNQPAFLEHLVEFASRQRLAARVRCECRELKKGELDPALLQVSEMLRAEGFGLPPPPPPPPPLPPTHCPRCSRRCLQPPPRLISPRTLACSRRRA